MTADDRTDYSAQYEVIPPDSAAEWEDPIPFGASGQPEPFPHREALPDLLSEYVEEVARVIQVDVAAPASSVVVGLSGASGNFARVRVSSVHCEANLSRFDILGMQSGDRKSSVDRAVTEPFDWWVRQEQPAFERRLKAAESDRGFWEKRAAAAERDGARAQDPAEVERFRKLALEARGEQVDPPVHPLRILDDITPEALVLAMHEQGGAGLVMSADARQIVDIIKGRYRDDGGTGDSVFLKAHGGDRIDRFRVSSKRDVAFSNPALAVGLMVQPDKLGELAKTRALVDSGFVPRCGIIIPRSTVGTRFETGLEEPLSAELRDRWRQIIVRILHARNEWLERGTSFSRSPRELRLSPEAMDLRRQYANEVERELGPEGEFELARSFASKSAGEAARCAALFHLALHAAEDRVASAIDTPIPPATWSFGECNQRWRLRETLRSLALAREDADRTVARRVLEWASRSGERRTLAARDIARAEVAGLQLTGDVVRIMEVLEHHRFVRKLDPTPAASAPRWEVHPGIFS